MSSRYGLSTVKTWHASETFGRCFCISHDWVKNSEYLDKFHEHYKGMIPWSTREQIVASLLKAFVAVQTVRIVIDATEYFCEKPGNLKAQYLTWSGYKYHNTFKVLIGVAPNGLVSFVSEE